MKIRNLPRYALLALGLLRDEQLGIRLLTAQARRILPRYKFTWPELAWFDDPKLNDVLTRFGERDGLNAHRRLALQQLIRLTAEIPGDTAECGVYQGCGSYLILQAATDGEHPRHHHIFDSFEGLSLPQALDGDYWQSNDLSMPETSVRNELKEFTEFTIYKGWIPLRFPDIKDRTFSFVHIDVDLYQPTLDSIAFFYDRLNPGGVLVCDDYGFTTCPGATAAIDEFLAGRPEKMLCLPGGGGFLIKGVGTA